MSFRRREFGGIGFAFTAIALSGMAGVDCGRMGTPESPSDSDASALGDGAFASEDSSRNEGGVDSEPPSDGGVDGTTDGTVPPDSGTPVGGDADATVDGAVSPSTCEPLASNVGTVENFRMRRIIFVAPPALATTTVQNLLVNDGVDMNEPQCGNPTTATGEFNRLLSLDTATNILTTGGAPPCDIPNSLTVTGTPSCDPFSTGYCFTNKTVNATLVQPLSVAVTKAADGTFSTTRGAISTLNIPIYFGGGSEAVPSSIPPSIIVLPISNAAFTGVRISADGNCIGGINVQAEANDCSDDYLGCSKWLTAGSVSGFITLRNANSVQIQLLNRTLCSLLTSDESGTPLADGEATCTTDASGNPTAKGNYCSTTNAPGGCEDSYWFAVTFAASAANINDGAGVPDCGGASDSGTD